MILEILSEDLWSTTMAVRYYYSGSQVLLQWSQVLQWQSGTATTVAVRYYYSGS